MDIVNSQLRLNEGAHTFIKLYTKFTSIIIIHVVSYGLSESVD